MGKIEKRKVKKKKIKKAPFKAKDTVHVNTSGGYKIVVKKGSSFAKGAVGGTVLNSLRPKKRVKGGAQSDPFSVENYNKRY